MKRRLLIIALFLLLGAVVNVAVAWGCAIWSSVRDIDSDFPSAPPDDIKVHLPPGWLAPSHPNVSFTRQRHNVGSGFGLRVEKFGVSEHLYGVNIVGPDRVLHIHESGWPALALRCHSLIDYSMLDFQTRTLRPNGWSGGIAPSSFLSPRLHNHWVVPFPAYDPPLPLRPIWPGSVINTLFYAGLLWLLIPGPFALRRFLRLRRGLCPKCAYPMGESAVCTECGKPLPTVPLP